MNDGKILGIVIKCVDDRLEFQEKERGEVIVTAGAGIVWDDLVRETVNKNLQGIEALSGIPGSVGAAPVQNIGAYGQELKDVFEYLVAYSFKDKRMIKFIYHECDFEYRNSFFKRLMNRNKYLITKIVLKLKEDGKPVISYNSLQDYLQSNEINNPTIKDIRSAVLHLRKIKLEDPTENPNAGSFFKNPIVSKSKLKKVQKDYPNTPFFEVENGKVKLFSGWLIDKAGWMGKHMGNAKVSDKNALVLTNPLKKATAHEVNLLAVEIQIDIKEKFEVDLEREVQDFV